MVKGSSSQASTIVPRAGGGRSSAVGPPAGAGGLRRRTAGRSGGGNRMASLMNFYTDDSPGLKMSPVVVIVMSLGYIFFVTVLHIVGKIRGV